MSMLSSWWRKIRGKDKVNKKAKQLLALLRPWLVNKLESKLNTETAEALADEIISELQEKVEQIW